MRKMIALEMNGPELEDRVAKYLHMQYPEVRKVKLLAEDFSFGVELDTSRGKEFLRAFDNPLVLHKKADITTVVLQHDPHACFHFRSAITHAFGFKRATFGVIETGNAPIFMIYDLGEPEVPEFPPAPRFLEPEMILDFEKGNICIQFVRG